MLSGRATPAARGEGSEPAFQHSEPGEPERVAARSVAPEIPPEISPESPPEIRPEDPAAGARDRPESPRAIRPTGSGRVARSSFAYRLVAVDLDGTVVGPGGRISRSTVDSLARTQRQGALVVVATGRAYGSADVFARRLGATGPVVACDGALVREPRGGRVHLERPLDPAAVAAICRVAEASGGGWLAFTRSERVVAPSTGRRPLSLWRAARRVGWNPRLASLALQVDRAHPLRVGSLRADEVVLKLVAWVGEGRPAGDLEAEIARQPVRLASGYRRHCEIVAAGVSKGHALRTLAESLGVGREEVLAFGDGTNDLEMLRYAGWGVAMRTAPGPVREAARAVTGGVEDDGVARALHAMGVGATPEGAPGRRRR